LTQEVPWWFSVEWVFLMDNQLRFSSLYCHDILLIIWGHFLCLSRGQPSARAKNPPARSFLPTRQRWSRPGVSPAREKQFHHPLPECVLLCSLQESSRLCWRSQPPAGGISLPLTSHCVPHRIHGSWSRELFIALLLSWVDSPKSAM